MDVDYISVVISNNLRHFQEKLLEHETRNEERSIFAKCNRIFRDMFHQKSTVFALPERLRMVDRSCGFPRFIYGLTN